jgi:hypothetical protein
LPRFYFDVSVGDDFTRDDVGFEYENLAVAEYQAARAAAEIGQDALPTRRVSEVCVLVRDEHGEPVLSVAMSMTVRRKALAHFA